MDRGITVSEILADAWDLAKKNFVIMIGFTAVQFASFILISLILTTIFGGTSGLGVFVQNAVIALVDAFFSVAFYQVFFKLIDEPGDPEFPDFIPNFVKALNFLVVKVIVGVALVFLIAIISSVYFVNTPDIEIDSANPWSWKMLPALILIIIPIVYFTIRLSFAVCFIVDQDSGSSESISQSWALTKGHFWLIFSLYVVMFGMHILGTIPFFIGLIFTVPFSSLIFITVYRRLVNSYVEEEEEILLNEPEDKNDA